MAANCVYAEAVPEESPVTPSMLAADGMTSNRAVSVPLWTGTALFCHAAELIWHPAAIFETVTGIPAEMVWLPAASRATAVSVCAPSGVLVLSQEVV